MSDRNICSSCQKQAYNNPKPVVNLIQPIEKNGFVGILLLRRGRSIGAGKLGLPAGYIEINETVEEAAIRETKEETGLGSGPSKNITLISSKISTSVTGNLILICYGTTLSFESIKEQLQLTPEASEIGLLYNLNSFIQEQLAFPSYISAITEYFNSNQNHSNPENLVYEKLL